MIMFFKNLQYFIDISWAVLNYSLIDDCLALFLSFFND